MAKFAKFILNEPKVIFFGTISSGNANDFIAITTSIQNIDNGSIKDGFYIKNVGEVGAFFDVKHNLLNHGSNTGFRINPGESLFLECLDIDDIFIKSKTNTTISYQVIGS